jgi:arylsulfatase A-like enzyme
LRLPSAVHTRLATLRRAAGTPILAAALTSFGVAGLAKLLCIAAVASSQLGRDQLVAELDPLTAASWLAQDLLCALVWGLCTGTLAVLLPPGRTGRLALRGLHGLFGAILGVSFYVYESFGVPPSWQLLEALGDGQDARASIAAMAGPGPLALVGGLTALGALGVPTVNQWLAAAPRRPRHVARALVASALLTSAAALIAPRSPLALHRNPLAAFVGSIAMAPQPVPTDLPPAQPFAEVLAPVARRPAEQVPTLAYQRIRHWAAQRRPNLLLVVLESTATAHMGVTGGPVDNTPVLSRLARRGLLWTRHHSHSPRSMTSLYSIVCGNYAQPFTVPISFHRPRLDCGSLSEILTRHGYRAGLFHSGTFNYTKKLYFFADRGYEPLQDAVTLPGSGQRYRRWSWGIEEAAAVDALLDWVRKPADGPFFATYVPVYPHHPYPVPEGEATPFADGSAEGNYHSAVLYVDRMLGRLMTGLEQAGVLDDTLVLLVGDHGEAFAEHPGSRMHGSKLYDEQVRTFALWYAAGTLGKRVRDPRPFGHADLAPTLLDLLGLPADRRHAGTSALAPGPRPLVPLYLPRGLHGIGFVDGRWKFIHDRASDRAELYDLATDPGETRSLAAAHPREVAAYLQRTRAFQSAQAAWEQRLGDLPATRSRTRPGGHGSASQRSGLGRAFRWIAATAGCDHARDDFAVHGTTLHLLRPGNVSVRCAVPAPPVHARARALTIRGREAAGDANIIATAYWESPTGERHILGWSTFNGSPGAATLASGGQLVPEPHFGPGGQLVVELEYKFRGRALVPEDFRIDTVELDFDSGGAPLDLVAWGLYRWAGKLAPDIADLGPAALVPAWP